jgi:galactoside O-acetyltransferase
MEKINSPQYDKRLLKSCGEDVFVSANVEIRRPHLVCLGEHIAIDTGFYLTTAADFGDYIHVGPYVKVIGGAKAKLTMGNFTNIAAGCTIICASDQYMGEGLINCPGLPDEFRDKIDYSPVIFDNFANVGAHTVILPGVTLAEGCVIGACSLVTKSTEPWTVYIGVPARPVKIRPKEKMLRYAKELGY